MTLSLVFGKRFVDVSDCYFFLRSFGFFFTSFLVLFVFVGKFVGRFGTGLGKRLVHLGKRRLVVVQRLHASGNDSFRRVRESLMRMIASFFEVSASFVRVIASFS